MAAPQKQEGKEKVSRIKVKKKAWYKILSPKMFGNHELGETYLTEANVAMGRILKINLKDLTGNVRDQNAYVIFQVTGVNGTSLQASTIGYELTSAYVKRAVRKNTNRLDDYFVLQSKDGKAVVVKTLLVTQHKIQRSLQSSLRELSHQLFAEDLEKGLEMFLEDVFSSRLQSGTRKRLAKLYPLKEFSIRSLMIKEGGNMPVVTVQRRVVQEAPADVQEQAQEQELGSEEEVEA